MIISTAVSEIPYSLKFSRTKFFVVCQISLEKVIFVIIFVDRLPTAELSNLSVSSAALMNHRCHRPPL